MKKIIISFLGLLIFSFIISSCKKNDNSVSAGNTNPDNSNYFPSTAGSHYQYNFERTDSANQQTTGIRDSRYQNFSGPAGNGIIYDIMQIDSVNSNGSTTVYTSLFRKADNGIYYYLDTTGFSENLPPEFIPYLPNLQIDPELLLLPSSLQDGKTWTVFKISLVQGLTFTVVDVEASYLGKENIALNLQSGTVTKSAVKIQYNFSLLNPITQAKQTVTTLGWYVADIGAVKWEGNGLLLDVFTRGEINFADSTSTGSDNLIDYNISK
jgi:hypothetical protein